jgi:rhodanese-related sulfurtransferase
MATDAPSISQRALTQQGYDYSPTQLSELSWGLRFTPAVCMALAVIGLVTQQAWIHFGLAALGILPFWFPAWHPLDRLYNHVLRPLWKGVMLPPNPLPRRIACLMGGTMNIGIGTAFAAGSVLIAYLFGTVLITLQLIVIITHFCVASWLYEGLLRLIGRWTPPISSERAHELVEAGALLVDVREPDEFARGHLPGSVNLPLSRLEEQIGDLARGSEGSVVLYCQSGLRSQRALALAIQAGSDVAGIYNLGAMSRWGEV